MKSKGYMHDWMRKGSICGRGVAEYVHGLMESHQIKRGKSDYLDIGDCKIAIERKVMFRDTSEAEMELQEELDSNWYVPSKCEAHMKGKWRSWQRQKYTGQNHWEKKDSLQNKHNVFAYFRWTEVKMRWARAASHALGEAHVKKKTPVHMPLFNLFHPKHTLNDQQSQR